VARSCAVQIDMPSLCERNTSIDPARQTHKPLRSHRSHRDAEQRRAHTKRRCAGVRSVSSSRATEQQHLETQNTRFSRLHLDGTPGIHAGSCTAPSALKRSGWARSSHGTAEAYSERTILCSSAQPMALIDRLDSFTLLPSAPLSACQGTRSLALLAHAVACIRGTTVPAVVQRAAEEEACRLWSAPEERKMLHLCADATE
jgi:hypothetical protein